MGYYLKVHDVADNDLAKFANNLVQHLGVEDALRVCRENSWEGVMAFIKGRMNQTVQS